MVGRIIIVAASLAIAVSPAAACDLEMSEVQDYLAYVDFRGMNEQQQLEAEKRAAQEFHDKKMAQAKASFLSRYRFNPDAEPVEVASNGR